MKMNQYRKYVLDADIYGEMVVDKHIEQLKEHYKTCSRIILIYGIKEKELRATPKDAKVGENKLRSNLLGIYDIFAGKHELSLTEEHKRLADDYYSAYREFGGSKSKDAMQNDLLIVAFRPCKKKDVVCSEH